MTYSHNRLIQTSIFLGVLLSTMPLLAKTVLAQPADRLLLAQRIVEGLPPPPDMPYPQSLQPSPSQSSWQAGPPTQSSLQSTTPTPARSDRESVRAEVQEERYLVYINGDSPLLLDQVRQIESGAFVQNYRGQSVIQTGLFTQENRAAQQVEALEAQGIGAEMVTVSSEAIAAANSQAASPQTASPQTVSFASSPTTLPAPALLPAVPIDQVPFGQPLNSSQRNTSSPTLVAANNYYVVIPGRSENLDEIVDYVTNLGTGLVASVEDTVVDRQRPLGSHVRVGPFVGRAAAGRWSRYFRSFGLDARVDYR